MRWGAQASYYLENRCPNVDSSRRRDTWVSIFFLGGAPRDMVFAGRGQKRDPAKISGPCASPSSRRWDARRCGGAMGRGVARRAQDDEVIRRLRTATKKAHKRDPAKISGPCASPSLTSWCAHPRGLSRGGDDANVAQHDDVAGRLRSAFSTIEGRAGRRRELGMTGGGGGGR